MYMSCMDMQSRPPTDECVAVVAALVRLFSPERTFIVSKCSEHVQRATVVWLRKCDFFARTGVLPAHVAFCRNRSGIEGEGEALAWAPLAPPEGERLTELCEATAREPEELAAAGHRPGQSELRPLAHASSWVPSCRAEGGEEA